jgi:hypothetical protein
VERPDGGLAAWVVQDPTGEEGFEHGGWFTQVSGNDREAFGKAALDEALAADAFLLGRRTYQFLASRWPSRTGALADRLNSFPKYVVSSTLDNPKWNNTRVLKGDPAAEVSRLKQQLKADRQGAPPPRRQPDHRGWPRIHHLLGRSGRLKRSRYRRWPPCEVRVTHGTGRSATSSLQ